jgi:GntR family transcriptional regulator
MYKQVADYVAQQILGGELPPGSPLPSETELITQFGVSRQTIRAAMAEMRAMGLVDSSRGKRSAVRAPVATAATTVERAVHRRGKAFDTGPDDWWRETETPTVTRTHTKGITAELLEREGEHTFAVERLLTGPTGVRAAHTTLIPFDVAEAVPVLAQDPDRMPPAEIYAALTEAGERLTWRETVTARAPHPDERTSLHLSSYAAPILLITYRATLASSGRPLILEELRVSADHARLAYTLTAAKPPTRRQG